MKKRNEILDIERKMHFSYDLEETITEEELQVNEILNRMRQELKERKKDGKTEEYNIIIHDYF